MVRCLICTKCGNTALYSPVTGMYSCYGCGWVMKSALAEKKQCKLKKKRRESRGTKRS